METIMSETYKNYTTWSLSVRWFHWINVLCVLGLIFVGLIMLYKKDLGITSLDAKVALKTLHVTIGYVFATNLLLRFFFALKGPASARLSAFLPGKGFMASVKSYRTSLNSGKPQQYIGHNPLGKLAVTTLFTLLIVMSFTGIIRA
jgi:Ni,Fe-hydrogenase I cytochrome b subunit